MSVHDYYRVLEVPASASREEVRAAFKRQAKRWHPDVNRGDKRAEERFKQVNEAYRVLGSPLQRRMYDLARDGRGGGRLGTRPGGGRGAGVGGGAHGEGPELAPRQGAVRLKRWEAETIGWALHGLASLTRKFRRPLRSKLFWLGATLGLVALFWLTYPYSVIFVLLAILAAFGLQILVAVYVYVRWLQMRG